MNVFGISIVRNEADILRVNILHHISVGIDRFIIIDNDSSDGTRQVLHALSAEHPIDWTRCRGAFLQSELTTELAREAFLRGADWVIPIDADEFWYAPRGDLRGVLARGRPQVLCRPGWSISFSVANRSMRRTHALLHMTMRAPHAIGPVHRVEELVETRKIAFVRNRLSRQMD